MNAKNMWEAFAKKNNLTEQTYEAWAFGAQADELAELVRRGEKTATASAYPLYELGGDPLPKEGEYSVILNSREEAVCIIRTTKVYVVPILRDNRDSRIQRRGRRQKPFLLEKGA